MPVRDFVVPGEDRETTSRNAGVLGGAYCNLFAPRPMLGRLPGPVGSPGGLPPAAAPLTVFAVRDPAVCELPVEHYGFAEPTLDPGVAQSGQLATVLSGSLLTMSRDGEVGPPASMPVEGEAAVYFGPDGAFALTNFELHQANPEVRYTDSTGTYVVSDGVLRMADLWAGVYEGPGVTPNVTVTAHRSSTTMAFTFNGERWSIPLAPDRPPEGDFDGVDQLVLGAHYYSEPDRAQFELTLRLRIHPRPTAVIDEVLLDRECRPLSDGRLGLVLTASGHSAPGTTTWSLSPEWGPDATFTGPMRVEAGTTATFELPLGAPSDPPYALGFTVLAGGQANSDLRRGISVQDTTGPSFESASITPSCLWPPDHGYALFRLGEEIQAAASDACSPAVRVRISNVVSDQLDDELGSGSTDDDVIFGDTGLCVRSERSGGPRAGRSYTITLEASDAWGNISTHDLVLEVPHDRRAGCPRVPPSLVVADEDIDARCVFAEVPPLDPPRSAFLDPSLTEAVATAIDDSDVSPTETGCSAAPGIRPGASPALALGGLAVLTAISRRRRGRNR